MNSNKNARQKLERIYGKKCMMHEGLRIEDYKYCKNKYTGKSITKQLTFHHIVPERDGGKATTQNEKHNEKFENITKKVDNMEEYKILYNKLLQRYNNGCKYLEEHKEDIEKHINLLLSIASELNKIIEENNITDSEIILNGFK